MKLRDLEGREIEAVQGGAPGDTCVGPVVVMLCWDSQNNSTIKVDLGFFEREFSLQTYSDKLKVHNQNQMALGEFIRKGDDGSELYSKSTLNPGTWWGER